MSTTENDSNNKKKQSEEIEASNEEKELSDMEAGEGKVSGEAMGLDGPSVGLIATPPKAEVPASVEVEKSSSLSASKSLNLNNFMPEAISTFAILTWF